tara:strand:+ start:209 stop:445 length:237 start_codon:yes stop_codon:yes gene_type:complete
MYWSGFDGREIFETGKFEYPTFILCQKINVNKENLETTLKQKIRILQNLEDIKRLLSQKIKVHEKSILQLQDQIEYYS